MFTSDELRELYQEVILDHNKHPRNFGVVEPCTHHAEGFNPLCGDHLTITMTMHNGVISDVRFQGDGCAISKATASLLTSEIKGKTQEEAERIIDIAQDAVTSSGDVELPPLLGKMSVIAGVREFPARVKCATLAMHTVKSALHGEHQATTE
ncbi:MAG: Fe-S cluster assembly sulfur transfer protein SufU [Candidatus Kapaibacterium sp.]|jgi:nitrogen fixation NifU-like protein